MVDDKELILELARELANEVELTTDTIRFEYSRTQGDHLERLRKSVEKVYAPAPRPKKLEETLERLHIDLSAIHYRNGKEWVPIIFRIAERELSLYQKAIPAFGIDMHFAMMESAGAFTVKIPRAFFGEVPVQSIADELQKINEPEQITVALKERIRKIEVPKSFEGWVFCPEAMRDDFARLPEFSIKIATSCFLTLRGPAFDHNIYFYNDPDMGGIASVSRQDLDRDTLEKLQPVFRRVIFLVATMDGFLKASLTDYNHYKLEDTFAKGLGAAAECYVRQLQRPQGSLGNALKIDYFNPITVVKRVGNKNREAQYRIILRLNLSTNDAFNFLYADNAMVFNKLEEYLNGWVKGYVDQRQEPIRIIKDGDTLDIEKSQIKLNLDVYIPPTVRDIEARNAVLYTHEEIPIKRDSNFWIWSNSILTNKQKDDLTVPAVIYRFSETVGPSIFVGEIASEILRHYIDCQRCCPQKPISVLNLFSGTHSCELTIIKKLEGKGEESIPVNFLSIDRWPFPLYQIPDMQRVKKHTHVISADIFRLLLASTEGLRATKESNDLYSKGYDMVIADPPHYLSLDFLYQRVKWLKKKDTGESEPIDMALFEHLADRNKTKCFILYFGHKEKEWMGAFIHRILTKAGWNVWSVLIGDERILACFTEAKHDGGCVEKMVQNINKLRDKYDQRAEPFNLRIYGTLYREL